MPYNAEILAQTYETHITVECPTWRIPQFREDCESIGVKPIVLDLQNNAGESVMQDIMTSSKYVGPNPMDYMASIEQKLVNLGYSALRSKLETTPWHPAAPTEANGRKIPKDCYFEAHLQIETVPERLPELREICMKQGAHLSRNVFKNNEFMVIVMATLRKYDQTTKQFVNDVTAFDLALNQSDFWPKKIETEYAIYDSNVHHDKKWVDAIISN